MKNLLQRKIWLAVFFAGFFCPAIRAQNLDIIGVTLLRAVTTNLDGAGIRVAQAEAGLDTNNPPVIWEVNPAAVGQPTNLFTYNSSNGSSSNFPNFLGSESSHADSVANNFYGVPNGVATNVASVDNYEADYYFNSLVATLSPVNDSIVNQSFTFGSLAATNQEMIDSAYDDYAAQFGALFVSAACNADISATVCAPGTSYNCISVGAYFDFINYSSVGPTSDNGRAKPDITAPSTATSFSTPLVAGTAAVLMQAGLRGDGGDDTNSAADIRTIKSLLLNGAIKPADWTNDAPSPLDYRYGAGVLNVFNSYEQLAGGKHAFIASNSVPAGSPHPPDGGAGAIGALSGWDFSTNSSDANFDGVNHYYFDLTNNLSRAKFTATATLVWNRHKNKTGINNLDLFLYNCADSNLVAASTSLVDNVQHIWLPQLPQGRYDLQVLKSAANSVSDSETYALAWEFFSENLTAQKSGTNLILSWPVYPDGFVLESATNLISPDWTNNLPAPIVTNNRNVVSLNALNATNAAQFFRLRQP